MTGLLRLADRLRAELEQLDQLALAQPSAAAQIGLAAIHLQEAIDCLGGAETFEPKPPVAFDGSVESTFDSKDGVV